VAVGFFESQADLVSSDIKYLVIP